MCNSIDRMFGQHSQIMSCLDYEMIKLHTVAFFVHNFSPWRITEDMGGAFAMGAIGGSVFHAIKGFRYAPTVSGI